MKRNIETSGRMSVRRDRNANKTESCDTNLAGEWALEERGIISYIPTPLSLASGCLQVVGGLR